MKEKTKVPGNWHWLLLCLLAIGYSCRKYNDPWGCKDCPLENSSCDCANLKTPKDTFSGDIRPYDGGPFSYEANGARLRMPRFNPANPNQITFYETKYENGAVVHNGLFIYDRESKSKYSSEELYGYSFDGAYTWDLKENLYFQSYSREMQGGGVFKLNTRTLETEAKYIKGGDVREVTWIEALQRVGFEWSNGAGKVYYFLYSFEEDDVDTFPAYATDVTVDFPSDVTWSKDLYLYTYNKRGTAVKDYNVNSGKYGLLASYYQFNNWNGDGIANFKWHPQQNTLYLTISNKGLYYARVGHLNVVRLKRSCENWQYEDIDISGDGKEIVVLRKHSTYGDPPKVGGSAATAPNRFDGWYYFDDKLYIMDIDGCNERLLFE
ncbi:hypothetical protein GC194_09170 [bacterium]|nr:hypothetical protein [bacterium]